MFLLSPEKEAWRLLNCPAAGGVDIGKNTVMAHEHWEKLTPAQCVKNRPMEQHKWEVHVVMLSKNVVGTTWREVHEV